jgi:hypothetical protein
MNAEGTKRLTLIKSLVEEQGADGDKRWLIGQLEAAETTRQSLIDQSSRWEAQALEAGVRIAEQVARVRELRDITTSMMHYTYPTEKMRGKLVDVLARLNAALAEAPKAEEGSRAGESA